ncbi:protein crumbs homolog 2-like isoform X2 [Watersipora subatra]
MSQIECHCPDYYFGENCEYNNDTELCQLKPCNNHGRCGQQHNEGVIKCLCYAGYYGTYCDLEYNECESSPCLHGVCLDGVDTYECNCNDTGFSGTNCQHQLVPPTSSGSSAEWALLFLLIVPLTIIAYGIYRVRCRRKCCKVRGDNNHAYVILADNPYYTDGYSLPMTQRSR